LALFAGGVIDRSSAAGLVVVVVVMLARANAIGSDWSGVSDVSIECGERAGA
jgi:hypothetical protein